MIDAANMRFEEQIEYFKRKINVNTNSYLDVQGDEHDYLFMVAGANRAEIVDAFRKAVDKAIENGTTLEEFRKDFDNIVNRFGWKYNGGRGWRTRVIYDTNLYGAYNKGRLAQHLELKDVLPYWEYVHNDNPNPRLQHMAWDGLILPADDPWWTYYYPIKAYGCHCEVFAHSEKDLQRMNRKVGAAPEIEWEEKEIGVRSGNPQTVTIPVGYSPGFEPHDFSKIWKDKHKSAGSVLLSKFIDKDPRFVAKALSGILAYQGAKKLLNNSNAEMVRQVAKDKQKRGRLQYVGVMPYEVIERLDELGKAPQSAVIVFRDEDFIHATRTVKKARNAALPQVFWEELPERLQNPKAILLQPKELVTGGDKKDTLLFIYETENGKVVVKMDYEVTLREPDKKKRKAILNIVRSGELLDERQYQSLRAYEILWGEL